VMKGCYMERAYSFVKRRPSRNASSADLVLR
jgi:hypothetical protein